MFDDVPKLTEDILSFVEQDLFGEWIVLVKGANDGRLVFLLLPRSILLLPQASLPLHTLRS